MDRDDYALIAAAADRNVHLSKTGDDAWEVGAMPDLGLFTNESAGQVATFLAGDRIRLPDGREFTRVMTTAEARETFELDPIDAHQEQVNRDHSGVRAPWNRTPSPPSSGRSTGDWSSSSATTMTVLEVHRSRPNRMVAANDLAVTIAVRHAQDTDGRGRRRRRVREACGGDCHRWSARLIAHRRGSPRSVSRHDRRAVGRLSIGDADGDHRRGASGRYPGHRLRR